MNKFLAMFRFVLKVFFGQPIGIIIGVMMPSAILIILPYVLKGNMNVHIHQILSFLVPGIITLPILTMGLLGIPLTLTALKESSILKKTNVINVSSLTLITALVSAFIFLMICGSIWVFTLSKIIWQNDSPNPVNAYFIIPYIMTGVITIFIGLIIGNFAKTTSTGFALGIAIFLPISFLSGTMFPQITGVLNKIAKFIPINETTLSMKYSWSYGSLDIKNRGLFCSQVFDTSWKDNLLTYIYPNIFSFSLATITLKTFKWE